MDSCLGRLKLLVMKDKGSAFNRTLSPSCGDHGTSVITSMLCRYGANLREMTT